MFVGSSNRVIAFLLALTTCGDGRLPWCFWLMSYDPKRLMIPNPFMLAPSVWDLGDVGHSGTGSIECAMNPMLRLVREFRETFCAVRCGSGLGGVKFM